MAAQRDMRATMLVVSGLVVAGIGIATIGIHPHLSPDGRAAIDGFLMAACLAGGAVGLARYRSSGDTHPLFVAAGLLVIATQTLVFDQNWILSDSTMPWEAITLPADSCTTTAKRRKAGWYSAQPLQHGHTRSTSIRLLEIAQHAL